jgi:succinate dehydrogenase / fumarate reductase cytochrome b subunit
MPRAEGFHFDERTGATSVVKKAAMAASGFVLSLYVVGHLAGNLLYYAGPERLDAYGAFLHASPVLLYCARAVLLVSVAVHVAVALDLSMRKSLARPIASTRRDPVASSLGARSMLASGIFLLVFVVVHLLHLTLGVLDPGFVQGAVWRNVTSGFSGTPMVVFYVVCMAALGLHLSHGLVSMTQSIGLVLDKKTLASLGRWALAIAALLALGFASIPIAAHFTP